MSPTLSSRAPAPGGPTPTRWPEVTLPVGDEIGPVELPPGTTLGQGRYRIEEVLGRGGFGITYAAQDRRLQRAVAIKELFPDGAGRHGLAVVVAEVARDSFVLARERFLREATTLARFGHPGIVRIWGALEEHGTAYLVLERLQGQTLAEELRARPGPFSQAEALDVAVQVAEALALVHRAGVLHRDVSPANLVRTDDGRVVLIDFGLARPFAVDRTASMTRIVTPGYASPEQHEGQARFGPRSDVYALAATLYRLVTGQRPPGAGDRARSDDLVPAWRLNPSVSRPVSDALSAALALEPGRRPPTVAALLQRLGLDPDPAGATGPAGAGPAGAGPVGAGPVGVAPPPQGQPVDPPTVVDLPARPPVEPRSGAGPAPAGVGPPPVGVPAPVVDPPTVIDPPLVVPPVRTGARPGTTHSSTSTAGTLVVPPARLGARPGPSAPGDGDPATVAVILRPRAEPGDPVPALAPAAGAPAPALLGVPPRGRAWVAVPLGLASVALASAQSVTAAVVLALGVAPVAATVGDRLVRPHRSLAWAPAWWLRNLVVGLGRSLGAACVLGVGLCLWLGTEAFSALSGAGPGVLRVTGGAVGWILASSIGRGGVGFRSHVALDQVAVRLLPRGRPTLAVGVLLVVCTAAVAAGLWFRPEAWPLGT